jgi:hypothetical protein
VTDHQFSPRQLPLQHAITRLLDRLTGLTLRAIGYGVDPLGPPTDEDPRGPSTLCEAHLRAEMAGELRLHSIAREV